MKMPLSPLFLLLFFSSGCIFDSSDTSAPKPQGFTYSISPLGIDTRPGGGGLILVSLDPSKEFTGNLFIRVYPPEHVRVVPQTIRLTHEWRFDEIEVYIDSTAAEGEMEMDITAEHEGVKYTAVVPIQINVFYLTDGSIMDIREVLHGELGSHNPPSNLQKWLMEVHPEIGIQADSSWNSWCEDAGTTLWGVHSFRYVSQMWDIRMQTFRKGSIDFTAFYWIRKRWEPKPFLYVKSENFNLFRPELHEDLKEISESEFGVYTWIGFP